MWYKLYTATSMGEQNREKEGEREKEKKGLASAIRLPSL